MFFFLLFICNIVFFVEWGEGGEGVSQDVVLLEGVSQDVVLPLCRVLCRLHWSACSVVLSSPASFCRVVFTCLVLLCCFHLPCSVVLSLPASLCCVYC